MFKNLNAQAANIGENCDLYKTASLARASNFQGIDIDIGEISAFAKNGLLETMKAIIHSFDLQLGGWDLPTSWKGEDDNIYQTDLKHLQSLAALSQELNCIRAYTWVLPYSDTRSFKENYAWHVQRLQPIARILETYNCQLALEFVGTKTFRADHRYDFIHTLQGMLELCDALGAKNVGLLLDSWHWYTSEGTVDDLKQLSVKEVIYVHVNDAPINTPLDRQIDTVRCLPGETGIIDLVSFLTTLKELGYKGPVTPEPFSKKLENKTAPEATRILEKALDKVWKLAELG
jgi:sugar phosphate isomerase/epimerase